jgi:hypothetical protein
LKTHLLEGNRCEIDQEDGEQIRLQNGMESFPEIIEERYGCVDEIA